MQYCVLLIVQVRKRYCVITVRRLNAILFTVTCLYANAPIW